MAYDFGYGIFDLLFSSQTLLERHDSKTTTDILERDSEP